MIARGTLVIARREAAATLRSPITLVVAVLFLVVQGVSFARVLEVYASPLLPKPYGAVLRAHFGGTFLYWAFLLFTTSAIGMRLIAEDKRDGTWETLRTVPVSEPAIVLGKWLGALAFYALLWAPTLAYVGILRTFAPPGAAPDGGPVATAYLGVLVTGASFLAVSLFASTLTRSQVLAAVVSFAALILLFLAGTLPGAWARAVDLRRQMDDFARGVIDTRHVAFHAGLALAALAAAAMVARAGRLRRGERRRAVLGAALVAAAAALAVVVAHRHPRRFDATRAGVYTLDPRTRSILGAVRRPVRAVVLVAGAPEFEELYDEVRAVLAGFAAAQPLVSVEELDPALAPGRIDALAREHALSPIEVAGGGAVVFASGGRARAIGLLDMAEVGRDPATGGGRVMAFRAEAAFAAAVLDLSRDERPGVCVTRGHGEPRAILDGDEPPGGHDLALLAGALHDAGLDVRELGGLAGGVPARCRVVAVLGPKRALGGGEARAIAEFLGRGGRLLVAADGPGPTGLETVLDAYGVRLLPAVARDPASELEDVPASFVTLGGYGRHAITAPFEGRRPVVWREARVLLARDAPGVDARELARTSGEGFGDAGDLPRLPGPVAVAVAAERGDARVVVLGSTRAFTSDFLETGLAANAAFAASCAAWLAGREEAIGIGPKTPEQYRVVITSAQQRRVFWACVVALPLAMGLLLGLWQWRRSRS